MGTAIVVPLVDEGLGNSTYLVDLGDGRALVVDASRDLRAVRTAAQTRGLRIAFAADTHLHADFLSGARQLATTDDTTILAAAAGRREFPHHALRDEDEVDLSGLRLRALATPGHTDEHLSFVLLDGDETLGVFSGGSLLVGAAARTDLVDPARTEELARAQYHSLHRILTLPDEAAVWPTHGAGSFCSAPPGAERTSTIGREKVTNPLLRAQDEDAFVRELIDSLGTFPPYFRRLGELNRRGPALLESPLSLTPLSAAQVHAQLTGALAVLVDVRPFEEFAAGHVPGTVSIQLRDVFATWLGWVTPHDQNLVVVRNPDQDPEEILWQAAKIGYDNLASELSGGLTAWITAGYPIATTPLTSPDTMENLALLDIRQSAEFAAGHAAGAANIELGAVLQSADELPDEPLVVMCGHGERAMTAASILEQTGRRNVSVLAGGPDEWASNRGKSLAMGQ